MVINIINEATPETREDQMNKHAHLNKQDGMEEKDWRSEIRLPDDYIENPFKFLSMMSSF